MTQNEYMYLSLLIVNKKKNVPVSIVYEIIIFLSLQILQTK